MIEMFEMILLSVVMFFSILSIIANVVFLNFLKNFDEKNSEFNASEREEFMDHFSLLKTDINSPKFFLLSPIEWKINLYFAIAVPIGIFSNVFVALTLVTALFFALYTREVVSNFSSEEGGG